MQLFDETAGASESLGKPAFFSDEARRTVRFSGAKTAQQWLMKMAQRSGLQPSSGSGEGLITSDWSDLGVLDLRGEDGAAWLLRSPTKVSALATSCAQLCVLVDLESLDEAVALLDDPAVSFLCDPSDSEIISELVLAGLGLGVTHFKGVHDVTRDQEAMRLERLSEEVRRLASTIERLTVSDGSLDASETSLRDRHSSFRGMPVEMMEINVRPANRPWERNALTAPERTGPHAADIRNLIRARRMRDEFLAADLFADPAWDMLLDLLAARLAGKRVSVSSLCIAAAVPPTTALRWIRQLTERDIFERIADPLDGRRVFIALTDKAATALLDWVEAVRRKGGLLADSTR